MRFVRWMLAAAAMVLVAWSFGRVTLRELGRIGARDARTELVVMHWSGGGGQQEDQIVESSLRAFEAAHPGIVVRRINPGGAGDFYTKLQTMTAAGDPPDVFYVGAERIPGFAAMDLLLPLDGFVDGADGIDLDSFYPTTVEAFRYDPRTKSLGSGPLWGVPKDFTTVGFYVNLDLFRAAGIAPPANDWTWDDFARAARAIGALPQADAGAVFVTWPMMVRAYLRTEGVEAKGATFDEITLPDARAVAALDRLRAWRLDEPKTILRASANLAEDSVFLGGRVGMAGPFGRWVVPSYRTIKPPSEGGFDWDFRPLPRGSERANAIATVSWSIARGSRHPGEAWELVRWLTSAQSQAEQARLGLAIPTVKEVARSDSFCDPLLPPRNHEGFLGPASTARVIDWPEDPQFEALLGTRLDDALKHGKVSTGEAVAQFERDWSAVRSGPLARAAGEPMPWGTMAGIGGVVALLLLAMAWHRLRGGITPARLREERAGLALASPWIVGVCVFLLGPALVSALLALCTWSGLSPLSTARFVGLANFEQAFGDDTRFRAAARVTAYYALLAVPAGQALALAVALLLHTKVRPQALLRGAWYLPSVLAGVGAAVLWQWVFEPRSGLLNAMLSAIGISGPDWLGADAHAWAPPAFALMSLWYIGGSMMVYLAGLQQVPRDLLEASGIDGAGAWTRFVRVTLPMLSPVILFNLLMSLIGSLQVFTQAFILGGSRTGDDALFFVLYLYEQGFVHYRMGFASALAWVLLAAILLLTVVILRTSARVVYYEGLRS